MPINFTCPNCGYKKPISRKLIGRKLKCPKCEQTTRMSDDTDVQEVEPINSESHTQHDIDSQSKLAVPKDSFSKLVDVTSATATIGCMICAICLILITGYCLFMSSYLISTKPKVDKQREARMERDLEAAQDQLERSVGLGMGRNHINQILAMKDGIIDQNVSSRMRDIKARKESARKHFFSAIGSLVISFLFMAISMIVNRLNKIANSRTKSETIESQR